MASQETPQMTEKTAQNVAAPPLSMPAPTHSLPQELVAAGYQPYYQPYPGQQAIAPAPVETSKNAELTKLALHGVAIVLGAIGLGLSLASLTGGNISVAIAACPSSGIALLWSLAEVITRAVRRFKTGIHPGAHVGMCLVIWMLSGIMGGILCAYVALTPDENDLNCYYGSYDSEGNLRTYNMCGDRDPYPRGKILGAAVITCLLFALFFGLFVDACICTHRRNTAAKRPIMVIAQPQNWSAATQGWQPMPQHDASTEAVQIQTPIQTPAATQEPAIREYYAPA
ncbi:hypothetical protein V8C37DRAFT_380851 [Trichoderma ceciliae]